MEDKSNEITAISALIDELDITDALVSIDTIDCQHDIAKNQEKKRSLSVVVERKPGKLV